MLCAETWTALQTGPKQNCFKVVPHNATEKVTETAGLNLRFQNPLGGGDERLKGESDETGGPSLEICVGSVNSGSKGPGERERDLM